MRLTKVLQDDILAPNPNFFYLLNAFSHQVPRQSYSKLTIY